MEEADNDWMTIRMVGWCSVLSSGVPTSQGNAEATRQVRWEIKAYGNQILYVKIIARQRRDVF